MKLTVSVILLCMMFVEPVSVFSDGTSWIMKAFLHNFMHANVFHLAVNLLAFNLMYRSEGKDSILLFFLALAIGTFSYVASVRNAIGLSDTLFAAIGLRTPGFCHEWWRRKTTVFFLLLTLGCLLIPGISATTHIAAFVSGVVVSRVVDFINVMRNDVRRSTGHR